MIAVHSESAVTIELSRLHRTFGRLKAVNDVSFSVRRGEVFGYIGPNGAGKTTSMRVLATLDLPTAGDAFVDGFSVINDPDHVRRRLGFMPDYFGAYQNVNCQEYLDFFARAYGITGAARRQAIARVMSFTGLNVLADKPISSLSKGMKQRVCLGRAMIHDPGVLILDEPAAGLDPRARIELREMIRQLAADGKTVLISSHILTELAEMCDTVAIIEAGRLVATGSVESMQRQVQAHREVEVKVLSRANELAEWLKQHEHLENVQVNGDAIVFSHRQPPAEEARWLREIIAAGFEVCQYGAKQVNLEDVFMRITQGLVQ